MIEEEFSIQGRVLSYNDARGTPGVKIGSQWYNESKFNKKRVLTRDLVGQNVELFLKRNERAKWVTKAVVLKDADEVANLVRPSTREILEAHAQQTIREPIVIRSDFDKDLDLFAREYDKFAQRFANWGGTTDLPALFIAFQKWRTH